MKIVGISPFFRFVLVAILGFAIGWLSGCAPTPKAKKFADAPTEFGPFIKARKIEKSEVEGNKPGFVRKDQDTLLLDNTSKILETAEALLDLEEKMNVSEFGFESEKLRTLLYSNPKNYTSFDENSSTYLELALGLAYDEPGGIKDIIFQSLDKNWANLELALAELKKDLVMRPQSLSFPSVNKTVVEIRRFLTNVPSILECHQHALTPRKLRMCGGASSVCNANVVKKCVRVDAQIVNGVREKLQNEFLSIIDNAAEKTKGITSDKDTLEISTTLEETLKEFSIIPAEILNPLISQIRPIQNIGRMLRAVSNEDQLFDVIFELWVTPQVDRQEIRRANEDLFNFLNGLSAEDFALSRKYVRGQMTIGEKTSSPILIFKLEWAKDEMEEAGLATLTQQIDQGIKTGLVKQFDDQLRAQSGLLANMIAELIGKSVGDSFHNVRSNLTTILRDEGKKELKKRMFEGVSALPAVENKNVQLKANRSQQLFTEVVPSKHFETDGRTLGLALSLQAKRLQRMEQTADKSSQAFFREIFMPINKLMGIGGYKYMESNKPRFQGLFRQITTETAEHDMDMFNYDLEKSYFAVPNSVVVNSDFTINYEETNKRELIASVSGYSELSRGAALMMNYMKDWQTNGFDQAIGKQTYKDVAIFPKEAFYALGIGVSSVPFRNLTRHGLNAFTRSGAQIKSSQFIEKPVTEDIPCENPSSNDPIVSVALTDVLRQGESNVVRAEDISRFILTSSTFLTALDGAEKSKARPLQKEVNGFKPVQRAIRCGRQTVKLLLVGLGNFLVSKMQRPDGLFRSTVTLNQADKISEDSDVLLIDQIMALRGLAVVYNTWKGLAYKNLATSGFRALNNQFLNAELGFYNKSLHSKDTAPDLYLMTLTVLMLEELESVLTDDDLSQARWLKSVWTERLKSGLSSLN